MREKREKKETVSFFLPREPFCSRAAPAHVRLAEVFAGKRITLPPSRQQVASLTRFSGNVIVYRVGSFSRLARLFLREISKNTPPDP